MSLQAEAKTTVSALALLLGAVSAPSCYAQAAAPSMDSSDTVETVTITGYRASLANSTVAKRESVGFSEAVFSEDIGKFPDTNIAESLLRIPGLTISREANGEGVNVAIRGLGSSFTKVLLNGNPIDVASDGPIDALDNSRSVDLNSFPTELFRQITVEKSPRADLIEGGAAGVVNLRNSRAFDNPGFHLGYALQGSLYSKADEPGIHATLLASNTWDKLGILAGFVVDHKNVMTTGWESGNAGWVTPGALSAAQCGAGNTCDSIGGNNWVIPATVPAGVTAQGLVPGTAIDAAFLTSHNPGMTTAQISNLLVPRFGRSVFEKGYRDRYSAVASVEYRATDAVSFFFDAIVGRTVNNLNRTDLGLGARAGSASLPLIPLNVVTDSNNVVLSGTFANARFAAELRPYKEKGDFLSLNPGMHWDVTDKLHVDFQLNASRSHFDRDDPTIAVVTASPNPSASVPHVDPPAGGVVATFKNQGTPYPIITANVDVNNPANFQWDGGRVSSQDQRRRFSLTDGAHLDIRYGDEEFNVQVGAAYDYGYRTLFATDTSSMWWAEICGGNPANWAPAPNSQPLCQGQAGSLIPQSSLASYLVPGPTGFITADFNKIKQAANWSGILALANKSAQQFKNGGTLDFPFYNISGKAGEKNYGLYAEINGILNLGGGLKYNAGLRWVETHAVSTTVRTNVDSRNTGLTDGNFYPNTYTLIPLHNEYQAFLPSLNLVYSVNDEVRLRGSISRTMTRPNYSSMIGSVNFAISDASSATLPNPYLKPFFSNNIDLGVEIYTGAEGYIGVDVFRKGISGFTTSTNTTVPFRSLAQYGITYDSLAIVTKAALDAKGGPDAATVVVSQSVNQPGLQTINGLEITYVQPLDILLEQYGLKGFGFTGNLTIVDQSSTGAAPTFATGIPPYTYNVSAYYENHGIMVRATYVYSDKTYTSASNVQGVCLPSVSMLAANCPGGAYLRGAPYGQLDFSSSLDLSNIFGELPSDPQLTFDVQNLMHSKRRTYDQWSNATNTYYDAGSVFLFGVRGRF